MKGFPVEAIKDMALKLGSSIGERKLTYGPKGRKQIIVRVGVPRKAHPVDWMCPFQISGIGRPRVYAAYGVDALQALQLVFKAIRFELARHAIDAVWLGSEPWDLGFPEYVPTAFGRAFANRISRLIAREEKLFIGELRRKRREARRQAAADAKQAALRGRRDRHGSAEPYKDKRPRRRG